APHPLFPDRMQGASQFPRLLELELELARRLEITPAWESSYCSIGTRPRPPLPIRDEAHAPFGTRTLRPRDRLTPGVRAAFRPAHARGRLARRTAYCRQRQAAGLRWTSERGPAFGAPLHRRRAGRR